MVSASETIFKRISCTGGKIELLRPKKKRKICSKQERSNKEKLQSSFIRVDLLPSGGSLAFLCKTTEALLETPPVGIQKALSLMMKQKGSSATSNWSPF